MTAAEFAACIGRASPDKLERVAELLQAEAWKMLAAGDAGAAHVEETAALFRLAAEQRRG